MQIAGILNLSEDSFSEAARRDPLAQGERLLEDGADWLDIGAEASNVLSKRVSIEEEITRLAPVVEHFVRRGAHVSIDTTKPEVFEAMAARGARMWNDIGALGADGAFDVAARTRALVVLMFSRTLQAGRASVRVREDDPLPEMREFFEARIDAALAAGIARERLILDPGMGLFLGSTPAPSITALRGLRELTRLFALPLYVCTSRKSFLGTLTGRALPLERSAATLASELFALQQGAAYIRTHDVRALRDAARVWHALGSE